MHSCSPDKHWYVLRAVFRKEITVRDGLRRKGFHCYVPMCYKVSAVKGHKVRQLVPAVSELVFVHGTAESIYDYKIHSKETVYWMTVPSGARREKMIVPDKSMENFIRVTQQNEQSVTYFRPEELQLSKGDQILIHGGPFDGVEGVLLKIKGKHEKQLLVSIPNLVAAAVSIKPDMVELISKNIEPSHNLQHDARELIRLSTQMLTATPDRTSQATEYDLLYQEVHRLYESLFPLKGYLPAVEGELSLALLMGEQVLHGRILSDTTNRFMRSLSKIKDGTLLSVRMQLIAGHLLHDNALLSQAERNITQWKTGTLSDRQRDIIEVGHKFL